MELFKELSKLGYKHYTEHTIEELDNLPLNSEERIMEQALVLRWFREKYNLFGYPFPNDYQKYGYRIVEITSDENKELIYDWGTKDSVEEAELACLEKLIEIVESKNETR